MISLKSVDQLNNKIFTVLSSPQIFFMCLLIIIPNIILVVSSTWLLYVLGTCIETAELFHILFIWCHGKMKTSVWFVKAIAFAQSCWKLFSEFLCWNSPVLWGKNRHPYDKQYFIPSAMIRFHPISWKSSQGTSTRIYYTAFTVVWFCFIKDKI